MHSIEEKDKAYKICKMEIGEKVVCKEDNIEVEKKNENEFEILVKKGKITKSPLH